MKHGVSIKAQILDLRRGHSLREVASMAGLPLGTVKWTYPDSTDRYWLDSQADDDTGAGLSTAACVACDERDAAVGNPCWV